MHDLSCHRGQMRSQLVLPRSVLLCATMYVQTKKDNVFIRVHGSSICMSPFRGCLNWDLWGTARMCAYWRSGTVRIEEITRQRAVKQDYSSNR